MNPEPISRTYRFAMAACAPIVRWWGRLEVEGDEHLPTSGPLLIVGNHDSHWDPVAIGIAGRKRRQIRALAKASLWEIPGLAPILSGMGQIPIERGKRRRGRARRGDPPAARRRVHRRLSRGHDLARRGPAGAQRRRPSGGGGARSGDRLRDRHGHRRHRPLPEAPADQGRRSSRPPKAACAKARTRRACPSGSWPRSESSRRSPSRAAGARPRRTTRSCRRGAERPKTSARR